MNSLVTVRIEGKDVRRFIRTLYKRGIRFYHLEIKKHIAEVTISYDNYLKLKDMKTIYEIHIIRLKGWIRIKQLCTTYKVFIVSLLMGISLLYFLSNIIFDIEVIHDKKEVREFLQEELRLQGIRKFSFIKTFDQGEKIISDILQKYRKKLEWLEIERIGTKYIIRVEERKLLQQEEDSAPRDITAKKKGTILSITSSRGEVIKKVNDYVEPGDVLISGIIKNKDTIKGYVHAEGQIFAEVWYHVTVEVPYAYKESKRTGEKHKTVSLEFLNFQKRLGSIYQTRQDHIIFALKNPLLPIGISFIEEEKTEEEDALYSYDLALLKAREEARGKLLNSLGKEDEIIYEKSLKNYEEDSKIVVEMFFKVKEDITSYMTLTKIEEPKEIEP